MKVRWSDDEIKFIKENYLTMNSVILSQHLNRSALSVKGKMRQLGLSLPKDVADLFVSQAASDMIKKRNLVGNKNPNWKGGISENNYHYKKLQVERYPERVNARKLVHNAIKDGKLVRGCCVICGKEKAHAHHEDYSKPLEVIWLCRRHHNQQHKQNK